MSLDRLVAEGLVSSTPETPVSEVSKLMKDKNVGAVLILQQDRKPLGIVTDRDLVLRVVCENKPVTTPVEQIMTRIVDTVTKDKGLFDVIELMRKSEVRRVPVVDERGCAIALLSFGDIFDLLAQEMLALASVASPHDKKIVDRAA